MSLSVLSSALLAAAAASAPMGGVWGQPVAMSTPLVSGGCPGAKSSYFSTAATTRIDAAKVLGPLRDPLTLAKEYWGSMGEVRFDAPQGLQGALVVEGSAPTHSDYMLELRVSVRGALAQSTRENLCRLTTANDLNVPRTCVPGAGGAFSALTYLYLPARLPGSAARPPAGGAPPFDLAAGGALGPVGERHLADVIKRLALLPKSAKQVQADQYAQIYRMARNAFATLPTPFTVVETGNFCGAVSTLLALTTRRFCPQCTFITIDPTLQSQQRNYASMACTANRTLSRLGIRHLATVVESFGAELPLREPIGLVYADDGKIREAMAPQLALLEPYLMDGAIVGFDDWNQRHALKGPSQAPAGNETRANGKVTIKCKVGMPVGKRRAKKVCGVVDHKVLGGELVSSGGYKLLADGEVVPAFGALQRTRPPKGAGAAGTAAALSAVDVEVALVQEKTGVACARAAIALPPAALKAGWALSSE